MPVWAFGVALGVLSLIVYIKGTGPMFRTALALLFNWGINHAFFILTGDHTPWLRWIIIDAITAAIILRHPAAAMQAMIGITYVCEIALHGGYGIFLILQGYNYHAQLTYWQVLQWVALLQIALAGGWFGGDMVMRYRHRRIGRHNNALASASRGAGVE